MPAMGLHGGGAQRPMTQLVLQQSVLLAHATPTARHGGGGVQRPSMPPNVALCDSELADTLVKHEPV
jgi:hypothetical protein